MDWVKLTTDYYRDFAIALGDDAREVMFTRGIALVGETESGGFIPNQLLHTLTRRPQHATRIAKGLVAEDLWEKVPGGYQVVNWSTINAELEKYAEKKRRDRDRKRAARQSGGQSRAVSVDVSADSPAPRPVDRLYESESKSKTAAAAAEDAAAAPRMLAPELELLRSRLEAKKLHVRWDGLTADQVAEIVALIDVHGDAALVQTAVNRYRADDPPRWAQAWLGDWRNIPTPGQRLAAVKDPPCREPGHSGTTRHCAQCAADKLAGDAR